MAFSDQDEPTKYLTEPESKANEFLGQPFVDPGTLFDWISPSHIANEFVRRLTGKDYFGDASRFFAGDWEAVWRLCGALKALSEAVDALSYNVSHGKHELDPDWDGNAAEAAFIYFTQLASGISQAQHPLYALAQLMGKAAEGSWRQGQVYSGLLKDAWDAAVFAAVTAGVGTGTSWTGIGAGVGWGAAGLAGLRVLDKLGKAALIPNSALKAMNEIVGLVDSSAANLRDFNKIQLPKGGYNHPAV